MACDHYKHWKFCIHWESWNISRLSNMIKKESLFLILRGTATGRDGNSGWVIGILGRRQATPRWVNDLVWQSEMLGKRQGTPRWADEPVWWIWRGLGNL